MTKNNILFENDLKNGLISKLSFNNLTKEKEDACYNVKTKKTDREKISIIIPTYNRLRELKELLDSIFRQSYTNYEIIIVDDSSTDGTEEFFSKIKNDKIIYKRNSKNINGGLCRQRGYKIATGDYIIFSDDDDFFIDDDYFKDIIRIFKNKSINVICSHSYIFYENEGKYEKYLLNFDKKISCYEYMERFQYDLLKPTSTIPLVVRKKILVDAHFENMKMMNDSSIYLRCLMIGGYTFVNNKIICIYRVHLNNYTKNVNGSFIIENLKEKKYIYNYIKNRKVDFDLKKWYKKQIGVTAYYYLDWTKDNKKEKWKVLFWILKNVSWDMFVELYKYYRKKM